MNCLPLFLPGFHQYFCHFLTVKQESVPFWDKRWTGVCQLCPCLSPRGAASRSFHLEVLPPGACFGKRQRESSAPWACSFHPRVWPMLWKPVLEKTDIRFGRCICNCAGSQAEGRLNSQRFCWNLVCNAGRRVVIWYCRGRFQMQAAVCSLGCAGDEFRANHLSRESFLFGFIAAS